MTSSYNRRKRTRKIAFIILLVILVLLGGLLLFRSQNHESYKIMKNDERNLESDSKYEKFGEYLIRYTHNGILEMDLKGNEIWEYSYEMNNPVISVNKEALGVADLEGNQIFLFDEKGYLGKVQTSIPIQKISVAGHGIVASILRDNEKTMIMCYDKEGNVLVEGKATLTEMGYPLEIALSEDAHRLLVSYVTLGATVDSTIRVYNLGDGKEETTKQPEFEKTYQDELIPTIVFTGEKEPVAVGTGKILFFSLSEQVTEKEQVDVETKVRSVLVSNEILGVVTEGSGSACIMTEYDKSGHEVRSFSLGMNYSFIEFVEKQVILMSNRECIIYSESGKQVFKGELESDVSYILPISGVNRYLFLGPQSIQTIELKK